jgi:hypothetical protein
MKRFAITSLLVFTACSSSGSDAPPSMSAGDDPSTTAGDDLSPSEADVPPEWSCLGEQLLVAREPARVRYELPVFDFDSQSNAPRAVPGLEVQVCGSGSCEQPLSQCTPAAPTALEQCYRSSVGERPFELVFDLPYGFSNATLRFTAPGYAELDYVLGGPMIGAPDGEMVIRGVPLPMFSETARSTVHADLGMSPVDPARGVLLGRVLNCEGARAAGVKVEPMARDAVPGAVAFRFESSLLAVPSPLETAAPGIAGFVNLLPGAIGIHAQTPGGEIATAVRVRPNVITIAELRPGLELWGQ